MKIKILLFIGFFCCLKFVNAQPGTLDKSFGKNGIVRSDIGANVTASSAGRQVLTQDDGSVFIVLEKNSSTLITKKHPNGSLDSTYGNNGYSVSVGIMNVHAALQKDGKIAIAGTSQHEYREENYDFALARFNIDGSLDTSFSSDGIQMTDITDQADVINSIAIQKDGKIIVSGVTGNEYYYDNTNNPNFSGYVSIARYNVDGSLDNTFGVDGILITESYTGNESDIGLQTDGKLVVSSSDYNGLKLDRFYPNGTLDTTFNGSANLKNSDGFLFVSKSLVIQGDGKIVSGGFWENSNSFKDFALVRFNKDGTLDNTFNKTGIQNTDFRKYDDIINSIAIQNDGKIVVIGYASNGYNNAFAIARYNLDGSLDITFDADGKKMSYISSNDVYGTSIAINSSGKLIAAGYEQSPTLTNLAVIVYNSNGSLDNTFHRTGTLIDHLFSGKSSGFSSSAVQNDGKVVTAGYAWNGKNYDFAIARFNLTGSFDSTFSLDGIETTDLGSNEYAKSVVVQSDGKIVVGGGNYLLRYNIDGSLDNTFSSNGKQALDFPISSIKLQKDGKILVTGDTRLVRYNSDGSFDGSFNGNGQVSTPMYVNDLALQSDGKIVVVGGLSIARYYPNSRLDSTFGTNGIITKVIDQNDDDDIPYDYNSYDATSVTVQNDGQKIIVGGDYIIGDRYYDDSYVLIDRYNSEGGLEFSSSIPGLDANSQASTVTTEKNGKIIVAVNLYENKEINIRTYFEKPVGFNLFRLNNHGSLDTTFHFEKDQLNPDVRIKSIRLTDNKLYAIGDGNFGYIARYLLTEPPTVNITTPANNTVYAAPATITINATASDADGTISSVKFYNGTTYLKTVTASPYTYTLSNLAAGTYSLTAKATDNSSLQTTSQPVTITVLPAMANKAPVVKITAPGNNAVYAAPATIDLAATATDEDGTISKVLFYNGSSLLKTDSTSPYTCTVNNLSAGNYSFTAKATDDKGLSNSSASVVVAVSVAANKAPSVSITNPVGNVVYNAPATINISAAATDIDGSVSVVKFYSNGVLLSVDSTSPYTYTIHNAVSGNYSLIAKATDNKGLSGLSAGVYISVAGSANKVPTVSITSPANNSNYTAPAKITINALAADADGTVSSVKFYNGTTYLKTVTASPYTYTITNLAAGTYLLTAKATDNLGAQTISAAVTVKVTASNKAPTVNITSPANNSTYTAPATITINALAADADGTISSVKFYNGTTYLKTVFSGPYTYTLPNLAAGAYSLTAKATDNLGAQTISAAVTVKVSNASFVSSKPYSKTEKTALNDALSLRIAPNPANNIISIYASGLQVNKTATLSIISVSGIVLKTINISNAVMHLNVSSLVSGVYRMKIVSGDKVLYKQFVKM